MGAPNEQSSAGLENQPSNPHGRGDAVPRVENHDEYEYRSNLGAGGMGDVYLFWDRNLRRYVAVKALKNGAEGARFEQECRITAKLPGIVSIYHSGKLIDETGTKRDCFLFGYIEGESLEDYQKGQNWAPMGVDAVLDIAEQLTAVLVEIHEAGIVHRDIKPSNIIFSKEDGRAHLIDFGIAMDQGGAPLTAPGVILFSEGYVAPERRRGHSCDGRADLYSLGVVLHRLLTGQFPQPSSGDHAELGSKEPRFAALLRSLLADDPKKRPDSALEVLERIRAIRPAVRTETFELDLQPPGTSSGRRGLLSRGWIALGALLVLAVALGLVAKLGTSEDPKSPESPQGENLSTRPTKASSAGSQASSSNLDPQVTRSPTIEAPTGALKPTTPARARSAAQTKARLTPEPKSEEPSQPQQGTRTPESRDVRTAAGVEPRSL